MAEHSKKLTWKENLLRQDQESINSSLISISESEVDIYQLKSWEERVFLSGSTRKYVMMHCSLWIYLKTFFLVSIISCQQRNMREEISKKRRSQSAQHAELALKNF